MATAGWAEEGGPSLHRQIGVWAFRGSMAGFGVSLLVHLLFLLIAAIWTVGVGQAGGAGGDAGRGEIELAVMSDTELSALQGASLEVETPTIADAASISAELPEMLAPVADSGGSPGLPGAADGIGNVGDGMGGAGGDIGQGAGLGESGSGGGGAASFFGVEATGTRFAYIVDTSGSMQGAKMGAMKVELLESIKTLLEHMQFFVSFFSNDAMPMGQRLKWTPASDTGKKWAADQAMQQQAYGGTNPLPAFQVAFDMTPRPDAIYFMTDGLFDEGVAAEVAKMNKRGRRVPIHCIAFDVQEKGVEQLMKRIAEDSGGRYTAVPLGAVPSRPTAPIKPAAPRSPR